MMKEKNEIPTVSTLRFLMHAGQILKNPLPFHEKNFERLGDTFLLNVGLGNKIMFSRNPRLAEYVLQKNHKNYLKSPIQTKDLAKYVGKGLLTSDGDHWKKQRKLIQPAFHKKQLKTLLDKIQQAIHAELNKISTTKPVDIFPIFNDLAFQTVVKALFSSAVGEKEISRLQYITEAAQQMLVNELRQPYKQWWFQISGKIERHLQLIQEARLILKNIVEERKKSTNKEGDLLDMLLDARYEDGKPMQEEQLIDEILILFTAGHETTSNALTFTCELLSRNPQVQEKIATEIAASKSISTDLMEVIRSCPYTNQVIDEAMRLYPPVYFIDRVNIEDDEFEGMKIPAGTSILLSIYEIHRHKEYWQHEEDFNPDRFAENLQLKNPAYYPFGAGPRKCIGNNFAMYEMILAISEIVHRFRIEEKKAPIQIKPLITLKPKNAILQFSPRST